MEREKLWAPWRMPYIRGIEKTDVCFLCQGYENPDADDEHLVVWRTEKSLVVLNRFPYNNGHLLIAPARHVASLDDTTDEEMTELMKLIREARRALSLAIGPHGFNVGLNLGRCAGAGLPDHMHIHMVPRWDGDTNFINVCSDTDVVSQSVGDLLAELRAVSAEHGLPAGL